MAITRRKFLGISAVAGASLLLPWKFGIRDAYAFAQSDPLRKWIQPIRGLGGATGIPVMSAHIDPVYGRKVDYYRIGIGEFTDVLHPDMGGVGKAMPTRLWGYFDMPHLDFAAAASSVDDMHRLCNSFHIDWPVKRHLGGIIAANKGRPVRIRFSNLLPRKGGHIIPLDTTLPGANQAFNRTAVHLHGGHVPWISDGGPHDWWTPDGQHGLSFMNKAVAPRQFAFPWQADYFYPNDQSARLMWYHEHAWGITRLGAYAGLATGYLLSDAVAEARFADLPQVPLIWQDKIFVSSTTAITDPTWATLMPARVQAPGSLWYQHVYETDRWDQGPGMAPPNPSSVPEAFGDTMLCNGTVYPYLDVNPGAYRFRLLNACTARFLNINLFVKDPNAADGMNLDSATLFPTNTAGPDIIQIGTEGGFLPAPATLKSPQPFNPVTMTGNLILGPAERADAIIDFSAFAGKTILMYTDAPAPFPSGDPRNDYFYGSPNPTPTNAGYGPDTRQILEIRVANTAPSAAYVVPALPQDQAFLVPQTANIPLPAPPGVFVRDLTLNEAFDAYGRLIQQIGTNILPGAPADGFGRDYMSAPTENITNGSTEVWRIFNLTGDTHPMHFHLANAQILSRQTFDADTFVSSGGSIINFLDVARGPEANELGYKETVRMNPGDCTSVIMKFELPVVPFNVPPSPRTGGNEYVWHCHILDHEEHDMMRPIVVT